MIRDLDLLNAEQGRGRIDLVPLLAVEMVEAGFQRHGPGGVIEARDVEAGAARLRRVPPAGTTRARNPALSCHQLTSNRQAGAPQASHSTSITRTQGPSIAPKTRSKAAAK